MQLYQPNEEVFIMSLTENARKYHERMFPGYESAAIKKDPEFIERFDNFAYDEVVNQPGQELPDKTRWMAILSTLIGSQAVVMYERLLPAAMNFDVTPVEIKEIVYQATAYLGFGRVLPFLDATNKVCPPRKNRQKTYAKNRMKRMTNII